MPSLKQIKNAAKTLSAIYKHLKRTDIDGLIKISEIKGQPDVVDALKKIKTNTRKDIYKQISEIVFKIYSQNTNKYTARIYSQILKLISDGKDKN